MLRASFIRVPAPGGPACTTNSAQCENGSFTRAKTSSLGTHHGRQLTEPRGPSAATDRRIDDVDALRFQLARQFLSGGVADRGVDRNDSAGLGAARQLTDHVAHLLVVEHGDTDDVGAGDVGDTVGQAGAPFGQRCHRLGLMS